MEPMERAVVPPKELHFSATTTFTPSSAAETAAARPAPPPPITNTSTSISQGLVKNWPFTFSPRVSPFGFFSWAYLKTEHLRSETDGNGFNRTVQTTRTTVPTLFRIFHGRGFLLLVKMDHI
jgi:hypothetical protein